MRIFYIFLAAIFFCTPLASASQVYEVTENEVHIRVDSTIQSDSLGFLSQGDLVEVVGEKFNWYRVVLPKETPCYVVSRLIEVLSEEKIRISATNVNLRYQPSLEAPVIGKASKNEIFSLIESSGEWLKIKNNSKAKGWVHKKFLKKQGPANNLASLEEKLATSDAATIYSTITVLSQMGKDNPELAARFLKNAKKSSLKPASAYLDVLQNILKSKGQKKAYFYQAQNNSLSDCDIKEALTYFEAIIEAKNTDQ